MSMAGKTAPIRELAVEMDFEVTRALELLEDHFVHALIRCR
jgi:hypothetical protein